VGGQQAPNAPPPDFFLGFSSSWMAFYSAEIAIMYSAIVVARNDSARQCQNGHSVSPYADLCEKCGAKIIPGMLDAKPMDAEQVGEQEEPRG